MSNLSENLNDVISAIDDIKTAIESRGGVIGECTSISEYADAINNLPDNVYSGTFLAFRQSDATPDVPQGGS
jgi:hypothetical protein